MSENTDDDEELVTSRRVPVGAVFLSKSRRDVTFIIVLNSIIIYSCNIIIVIAAIPRGRRRPHSSSSRAETRSEPSGSIQWQTYVKVERGENAERARYFREKEVTRGWLGIDARSSLGLGGVSRPMMATRESG